MTSSCKQQTMILCVFLFLCYTTGVYTEAMGSSAPAISPGVFVRDALGLNLHPRLSQKLTDTVRHVWCRIQVCGRWPFDVVLGVMLRVHVSHPFSWVCLSLFIYGGRTLRLLLILSNISVKHDLVKRDLSSQVSLIHDSNISLGRNQGSRWDKRSNCRQAYPAHSPRPFFLPISQQKILEVVSHPSVFCPVERRAPLYPSSGVLYVQFHQFTKYNI